MTGYTARDAARDTAVKAKEVAAAWHQARDDAAKAGGWGVPADRHQQRPPGK